MLYICRRAPAPAPYSIRVKRKGLLVCPYHDPRTRAIRCPHYPGRKILLCSLRFISFPLDTVIPPSIENVCCCCCCCTDHSIIDFDCSIYSPRVLRFVVVIFSPFVSYILILICFSCM